MSGGTNPEFSKEKASQPNAMWARVLQRLAVTLPAKRAQVEKDCPQVVKYLKTNASKSEIDLHLDVAEYLRQYTAGKSGLLFKTQAAHYVYMETWGIAGSYLV